MSLEEALETTQVYSVMNLVPPHRPLMPARPFRAPHHTISDAGLAASVAGKERGGDSRTLSVTV